MPIVTISEPAAYKVGSPWRFMLVRKNPDGSPIDITGLTARMQLRQGDITGAVILELTEGSGLTSGGAAGTVAIAITAVQSALFDPDEVVFFDVELIDGSDVVQWQSATYRFKTEAQVTV